MVKQCFRCGELKPITEFYKHKQMADGHLNKCIPCTKSDMKNWRNENIDRIRAYDRNRGSRMTLSDTQKWRKENPLAYKAHCKVNNAIRDGRLYRKPCEVCGTTLNIHAHHDDYEKFLDVKWLCAAHHHQLHHR